MGLFNLLQKPEHFFSDAEQEQIVMAIREAEMTTSGEIRVYLETKNPMVDPVDRAREIFYKLEMDETAHRNGVLVYLATKDKELAIFGDEGIYKLVGKQYWDAAVQQMIARIGAKDIATALQQCVRDIGTTLHEKFPYEPTTDKNELPDDIVFGS